MASAPWKVADNDELTTPENTRVPAFVVTPRGSGSGATSSGGTAAFETLSGASPTGNSATLAVTRAASASAVVATTASSSSRRFARVALSTRLVPRRP